MTEVLTQRSTVKRTGGFTLVELIAVIAVLLVIAIVAVVQFTNLIEAAERAAVQSDASAIARQINTSNTMVQLPAGRIDVLTDMDWGVPGFVTWTLEHAHSYMPADETFRIEFDPGRHENIQRVLVPPAAPATTWTIDMSRLGGND